MCCVLYLVCIFQIMLFVMSLKCLEKGLCLSWVDLQCENWILNYSENSRVCLGLSIHAVCYCGQGRRRGLTSWACAAGFCLVSAWSAFCALLKCKLPNSAASSRPDSSGWTLQCPFCPCICNWFGPKGPEFLYIPALVAECSQEMALPQAQALRAGMLFCQNSARLLLNICVPREIRTVRDEFCRSVLLQDTPQDFRTDPFPRAGMVCRVSFSSAGSAVLSPWAQSTSGEPLVLSPWLLLCWISGSSHNVQHRLNKSELWDSWICVVIQTLSAFFSCLKRVLSEDMKW